MQPMQPPDEVFEEDKFVQRVSEHMKKIRERVALLKREREEVVVMCDADYLLVEAEVQRAEKELLFLSAQKTSSFGLSLLRVSGSREEVKEVVEKVVSKIEEKSGGE